MKRKEIKKMEKLRVGIITKDKQTLTCNFDSKDSADNFVLEIAERFGVKYYKVIDRETKEVIEKGSDL